MSGRGGGGYASGKNALAICQRCADKIPYKELVYDGQYPDMRVCKDCWDPKHPQEYLPDTFDPITLYDATGDPEKAVANLVTINPVDALHIDPDAAGSSGASPGYSGYDQGSGGQYDTVDLPLQLSITINKTYYNFVTGPTDGGAGELPIPIEFLANFNGSDGATSYTEESDNAAVATFSSNAQLDTAQFKFGVSSLLLDGTGDYISFPDIDAYTLGTSDWTIEGWVRLNALPTLESSSGRGMVLFSLQGASDDYLTYALMRDSFGYRVRADGDDFGELGTIGAGLSTGTWYHWAITRTGGQIRAYFNGNYETGDFGTTSANMGGPTSTLILGSLDGSSNYLNGWLDSVRMTVGLARYTGTGTYTVPTEEF